MELNLVRTEAVLKEDNHRIADESERLRAALKEKDETVALLKEELHTLRPKIQLADVELGRYAMQIKQLEMQLVNEKMITDGLKQELEKAHTPKRKPAEALIEKVSEKSRDDLKMISGIGPVIESKLNAIGIYTFKQISEFTPETIDYVTSSIKFFPDRIGRDNWIGQAAALMRHRK
jgi:predicted flap endonuclease-1-like 5' DNA nuclease